MHFVRFGYGNTRFVILIGNVAIKCMRVRCIRLLYRGVFWSRKGKLMERSQALYKGNPVIGVLKYLLEGLDANIREYHFYREYRHLPLAPTHCSLLGLVNIQARGEAVIASEIHTCPFQDIAGAQQELDLHAGQYCRINGHPVLADYGNPLVQKALRERCAREMAFA